MTGIIPTLARKHGFIDEDTNTVTEETVHDFLWDRSFALRDYVKHHYDQEMSEEEAIEALEENDADVEVAAEWYMDGIRDELLYNGPDDDERQEAHFSPWFLNA